MSGAEEVTGLFNRDDYTIKAEIGTGQFGTVHRATWSRRGIDVALKHIRSDGADGGIKIKAEERGAELQRCFSSRYKDLVPEIFEHGRATGGDYYISMELVDGRPLTELIRASTPDSRKAAALAVAIGDFLVKLHGLSDGKEPILHSDLKPEHVLVLPDGSIRILDLGIAKSLQANKSLTGNAWASAPYASPERLEDGQVRAGDDHWALGVMLFEMASGYHPYYQYMSGDNNATLARAIRRTEPLAPLPTSCEAGLAASIRKMLSPQPAHRYQTAGEIVADLRSFLEGRETTAAAESAKASQRTQVIPRDATGRHTPPPDTVPTAPVPIAAGAAAAPRAKGRKRWSFGVLVRVALAALFIMFALSQGAACIRTEHFRQGIGGLQPADVPAIRIELENIRRQAMFGVPRRVRQSLQEHMVSLADRAILDFRNDVTRDRGAVAAGQDVPGSGDGNRPQRPKGCGEGEIRGRPAGPDRRARPGPGGEAGATERSQEPLHRICPPRHLVAGPVSRPGADQRLRDTRLRSAPRQHCRRRAARLQVGPAGTCASGRWVQVQGGSGADAVPQRLGRGTTTLSRAGGVGLRELHVAVRGARQLLRVRTKPGVLPASARAREGGARRARKPTWAFPGVPDADR